MEYTEFSEGINAVPQPPWCVNASQIWCVKAPITTAAAAFVVKTRWGAIRASLGICGLASSLCWNQAGDKPTNGRRMTISKSRNNNRPSGRQMVNAPIRECV